MKRNNTSTLKLDVRTHNYPALNFYRKLGFEIDNILSGHYNWHGGIALVANVDNLLDIMEQYKENNLIKDFIIEDN